MKQKLFILIISLVMPFITWGQTYSALWKKVNEAEQKDLPQTMSKVLQQIVDKATSEKAYGQLMKAELKNAQVKASVAPDSLKPAVEMLEQRCASINDEVLKTVYQTVLYRICQMNRILEKEPQKPELTAALCAKLAQVKDETYEPFVKVEPDSKLFNHDLLSIVGHELDAYQEMHDYYEKAGNRQAACLTALEVVESQGMGKEFIHKIDSLISRYGDLPEAGELAISRVNYMQNRGEDEFPVGETVGYARQAVEKWASWSRINTLKNTIKSMINPQFGATIDQRISLPMREQTVYLHEVRNLSQVEMKVYRVNGNGDLNLNPESKEDFKKLKPLLKLMPEACVEMTFPSKPDYEVFEDSIALQGLPIGVYMLEFSSKPGTEVVRRMFHVTDLFVMSEKQPDLRIRYVVVNATTGQPVAKAHVRIKEYTSWKEYITHNLRADSKGECYFENSKDRRLEVFAYTDGDKALPEMNLSNRYNYYKRNDDGERTMIYTDRAIYRPGQTVHAAAIVYEMTEGYKHNAVEGKRMSFVLRDANYKEVQRVSAVTDQYGTCSADLTLPSTGLTGQFSLVVNGETQRIRVEEYKRPTFEVKFDEVKAHYEAGDTVTVKATARSYAGVPVQGATVKYKVVRRLALWWWNYNRYWNTGTIGLSSNDEEISSGETVTGDDGTFTVDMPMVLPESKSPLFYNFIVTADVTDTAGETHAGQTSLPLGNRKTALSVDLGQQILAESNPTMTFHLRNAAGNDIASSVKYKIDDSQKWQDVPTQQKIALASMHLKSGKHTVEAICEGDTLKRDFVIFSKDDKRPATETDDWFWVSDSQFPNDGRPVTVQVGSSAKDVHIIYSIFSGDKLVESGRVDRDNELLNRKLTYKEEWGNGILLTFAWVKENVCYTHQTTIRRPLPNKQLKLAWKTFRDRLTPGQQEEWSLMVSGPDGQPANAQLMATLYDKSLDQLTSHYWLFYPYISLPLPYAQWNHSSRGSLSLSARQEWHSLNVRSLTYSHFDHTAYPSTSSYYTMRGLRRTRGAGLGATMLAKSAVADEMVVEEAAVLNDAVIGTFDVNESSTGFDDGSDDAQLKRVQGNGLPTVESDEQASSLDQIQIRENLNETAFFYPQLTTDSTGVITLKFTLPESLTTWRFMGLAHTPDMCYGLLEGETVAKKDVMIQPNMPRFVREGDQAVLTARIFNTSDHAVSGKARLRLLNPETETVVFESAQDFSLKEGATGSASFALPELGADVTPLICQVMAMGEGFSDGEQHYLPVLPSTERVTVTVPFTQIEPGKKTIDLAALLPTDSKNQKLTFEYTNNPAWLMIQALPTVGKPSADDAISQAASYYANSIGKHILAQNPKAKTAFQLWQKETGDETSLMSSLEKNQELKDLMLSETPWVLDADHENEQKQRLADFFDENTMQQRLESATTKLKKLQRSDGSWSWWPEMPGSFYMTVAISEMLVRLNSLTDEQAETSSMLKGAFRFMGKEIVEEVNELKKWEKKGHKPGFPSFKCLQWLYLSTLDGRTLPADVQEANVYLLKLLKKEIKNQSIYEKAMTAVILAASHQAQESDRKKALEYVQSLKEYTVYREEMGRYYDTPRAGYSWYDYKIPTQTMAIEALQRITPNDEKTIREMQRWLLQSKRTQAWDTPINSVNAVYAFLNGQTLALTSQAPVFTVDDQLLETPKATAAIGYVKTPIAAESKSMTIEKTSEGTSWGAVYAQFYQPSKSIKDSGSGLTVKREILSNGAPVSHLSVGDRIKVRITIEADRDYDFVQLIDRRAACMEPVKQLSGYHSGSYCTPRDNTTNYYFDCFSKGKHVIESEYYIDRPGTYETGSCTVMCAYAPEFRATTKSQTIIVK